MNKRIHHPPKFTETYTYNFFSAQTNSPLNSKPQSFRVPSAINNKRMYGKVKQSVFNFAFTRPSIKPVK
jgi:hypothetical protein